MILLLLLTWFILSALEFRTGKRYLPWSAYVACGASQPASLPATVRVGLYEEFPNPWRLAKLHQIDFPVTLALAAPSREEFLRLRGEVQREYPQVREVLFWPTLHQDEGYYLGSWSSHAAVKRVAGEANDLPMLWDLEMPRGIQGIEDLSFGDWWRNRQWISQWLSQRSQPVHIWRTHTTMGLNPTFLRLMGMHFDPLDYPNVSLHLDLYTTGQGLPEAEMTQMLRCGVERYGARFVPSLGVLNDREGPEEIFVPPATLRRNLALARASGASEIWLFGVNGLNPDYIQAIRDTLPLEPLSHSAPR